MKLSSLHSTRRSELRNFVEVLEKSVHEKKSRLKKLPDFNKPQGKNKTDWVARYEEWVRSTEAEFI